MTRWTALALSALALRVLSFDVTYARGQQAAFAVSARAVYASS